jgi:hypothetical protein
MSDDVIKNLKELSIAYEKHISEIRDKIRILESVPKAQALVGKCFKYRNSYFFGRRRRGWIYKRIVAAAGEHVISDTFEVQGETKLEVSFGELDYVSRYSNNSLTSISPRTYFKEIDALLKGVRKRGFYGKKKKR